MAIVLKRQLTEQEKERVLAQNGRVCFATGHPIPEADSIHFDHIRAFARGGESELNNVAPMCPEHNRAKGTLPLFDFRTKLRLDGFFRSGDRLTLRHLLRHLRSEGTIPHYGLSVSVEQKERCIGIEAATLAPQQYDTYECPITGWTYFYATLPIDILDSDDDQDESMGLQPRYLIYDKVFSLFRHFQTNPVLQPSLGRIVDDKIKLFDGQHKAAAILWNDRRNIECKIYVEPDMRQLNRTNISAHDEFSQTRFYTSIMISKLGAEFEADFEIYKNAENWQTKSEAGFVEFLRGKDSLTLGKAKDNFRAFLFKSVLHDPTNKLSALVSEGQRATDEKPIALNALRDSLFAFFMYREPLADNLTTDAYKRDAEFQNMISLSNMLYDGALYRWNPKISTDDQRALQRLIRARFMKAWSVVLKDAICAKLNINDADERARPFYRSFDRNSGEEIERMVHRLIGWKMWSAPPNTDIDTVRMDNDQQVRDFLRNRGLTTGYLMGASE